VQLANGVLAIKGEKKTDGDQGKGSPLQRAHLGHFEQRILVDDIDAVT
jgi:hypothetical protein